MASPGSACPAAGVPRRTDLVEIVTDWRGLPDGLKGAAVAIGAFDGVHRGHQAVIATAREAARSALRSAWSASIRTRAAGSSPTRPPSA